MEDIHSLKKKLVTKKVSIPTIGIGAGKYCDGQVQVIHDLLGLFSDFVPRHAKQYAKLGGPMKKAFEEYISEVKFGTFPTDQNSPKMDETILANLQ